MKFTFGMYLDLFVANKDLVLYLFEQTKNCAWKGKLLYGSLADTLIWLYIYCWDLNRSNPFSFPLWILTNISPTSVYSVEDVMSLLEGQVGLHVA